MTHFITETPAENSSERKVWPVLLALEILTGCRPPPAQMDFNGTTIPGVYVPKASRPRPAAEIDPRARALPGIVHAMAGPGATFHLYVARMDEPLASDAIAPAPAVLPSLTDVIIMADYVFGVAIPAAGFTPKTSLDAGTAIDFVDRANHCESRAHIIAGFLRNEGWPGGKVFANGDIKNPINSKSWSYHVAAYVLVAPVAGTTPELRVIDPGFRDSTAASADARAGVLTVDAWIAKFVTGASPEVAIEVTRYTQLYPTTTKDGSDYSPVESFSASCNEAAKGALNGYKSVGSYSWCR